MQIITATEPDHISTVRQLFREYAEWLAVDLCFQSFEAELADLPGAYGPPRGRLLLAEADSHTAGCVALRPLSDGICEMKRLYVRPAERGQGCGRTLARAIIAAARELQYTHMRLDTLNTPKMCPPNALYEALGFRDIPPYYHNPLPDARYLELDLTGSLPGGPERPPHST